MPRRVRLLGGGRREGPAAGGDRVDVLLNLWAMVVARWRAFVHSRDASAVAVPGTILSAVSVGLIAMGFVVLSLQLPVLHGGRHG